MTSALHAQPAVGAPHDAARAAPRAGTWADFDALYREHFRFAWRSVRRLGFEGSVIDDVLQDVFLVVHRRLADFEGRSSAKTWLYGIIRRVVADHRRTLRRKPALGGDAPQLDVEAMMDAEQGPEASAEQAERVRLLHRVLAELDDDKREAFVLAELEGLTLAEIGEALDVNANTIASRLRAARREFEAALERALNEDAARCAAEAAPAAGAEERRSR
jgi:RNA polymerase sigma-70 factor (ECF subfamily)